MPYQDNAWKLSQVSQGMFLDGVETFLIFHEGGSDWRETDVHLTDWRTTETPRNSFNGCLLQPFFNGFRSANTWILLSQFPPLIFCFWPPSHCQCWQWCRCGIHKTRSFPVSKKIHFSPSLDLSALSAGENILLILFFCQEPQSNSSPPWIRLQRLLFIAIKLNTSPFDDDIRSEGVWSDGSVCFCFIYVRFFVFTIYSVQ